MKNEQRSHTKRSKTEKAPIGAKRKSLMITDENPGQCQTKTELNCNRVCEELAHGICGHDWRDSDKNEYHYSADQDRRIFGSKWERRGKNQIKEDLVA